MENPTIWRRKNEGKSLRTEKPPKVVGGKMR
jgi:hypothetical protein